MKAGIARSAFGALSDGAEVHAYTLTNAHGISVKILDYGGVIVEVLVPDRSGRPGDVVLGFDTLQGYLDHSSFGAFIGRFANRIAQGRFTLDGKTYSLVTNNG